jgi:hypothetical protein
MLRNLPQSRAQTINEKKYDGRKTEKTPAVLCATERNFRQHQSLSLSHTISLFLSERTVSNRMVPGVCRLFTDVTASLVLDAIHSSL